MDNTELKQILLFLLQTAKGHESWIHDVTISELALSNAALSTRPVEVWEKYGIQRDKLADERKDEAALRLQRFDELILQVLQSKADDQA